MFILCSNVGLQRYFGRCIRDCTAYLDSSSLSHFDVVHLLLFPRGVSCNTTNIFKLRSHIRLIEDEFEDTKGMKEVIRIGKSEKDRQHNGKKKRTKGQTTIYYMYLIFIFIFLLVLLAKRRLS